MATKRLARQLGIIRSSSKTSLGGQKPSRPKLRQVFDYLIVIDFESTCWNDGRKHYKQEIIEFPAVLLNTSDGEIDSEFHMYVQPQEHPILSEFCTELTGITQNQVDEGVPLHICLSQFSKWIQKIQNEKKLVFHSAPSSCATDEGKLCTFVTWSDWDLGVCLQYECKRKQLRKPDILNSWIDLRATYKLFYCRKPQGLNGALQDVGILFAGREHSGLDDARNTARLAWRMIRDGCVMKITKSLDKALPAQKPIDSFLRARPTDGSPLGSNAGANKSCLDESSHGKAVLKKDNGERPQELASVRLHGNSPVASRNCRKADESGSMLTLRPGSLSSPLGCLNPSYPNPLAGIQNRLNNGHLISGSSACNTGLVLVSTTLSSVRVSDPEITPTSDCLSMLADWEDVALIPDSQDNQNLERSSSCEDEPASNEDEPTNSTSPLPFGAAEGGQGPNVANSGSESVGKTSPSAELSDKAVLFNCPAIPVYGKATALRKRANPFAFLLPATKATLPSTGTLKGHCASGAHKRKPSSPKALPPAKKPSFIVYEDTGSTSKSSLPFKGLGSRHVPPGALSCSLNVNRSLENPRVTPPLCQCGRRARRLSVSNGGPNHGRAFYSCPVGRTGGNRKGCGFFRWEQALLKEKLTLPSPPSTVGLQPRHMSSSSSGRPQQKSWGLRPSMRT